MRTVRLSPATLLAACLLVAPVLAAGEKVCRGKWDGTPIEIRLNVNDRSGAVSGLIYKPGAPNDVIASLKGRRLEDGSLEVSLTYRFEDFGTFVLKPGAGGSTQIWQTAGKDLWFGLSD